MHGVSYVSYVYCIVICCVMIKFRKIKIFCISRNVIILYKIYLGAAQSYCVDRLKIKI